MPASRGNSKPDPTKLAEWEAGAFSELRRQRDATTPIDDELPDDPLADLAETRSALQRIAGA